jgi:hypothetical protein
MRPDGRLLFRGQRSPGRQRIQNGNHARSNYGHLGVAEKVQSWSSFGRRSSGCSQLLSTVEAEFAIFHLKALFVLKESELGWLRDLHKKEVM